MRTYRIEFSTTIFLTLVYGHLIPYTIKIEKKSEKKKKVIRSLCVSWVLSLVTVPHGPPVFYNFGRLVTKTRGVLIRNFPLSLLDSSLMNDDDRMIQT